MGMRAAEGGQQRRVDVEHPALPAPDEPGRQHAHEAGEADELDAPRGKRRPPARARNSPGRERPCGRWRSPWRCPAVAGKAEAPALGAVRDDEGDLGRDSPARARPRSAAAMLEPRPEIRMATRRARRHRASAPHGLDVAGLARRPRRGGPDASPASATAPPRPPRPRPRRDDDDHADAAIEGAQHLAPRRRRPSAASQPKTGGTGIGVKIEHAAPRPSGSTRGMIVGKAAAGDMGERLDAARRAAAPRSGFT